jgi:hypothetical protein
LSRERLNARCSSLHSEVLRLGGYSVGWFWRSSFYSFGWTQRHNSMGDSASYIWTALTEWIPADRSYFYGYVVRGLAVWPHSFAPLLLSQTLASAVTAIVFVLIC